MREDHVSLHFSSFLLRWQISTHLLSITPIQCKRHRRSDLNNIPILSRNNGNEDKELIFSKNGEEKLKAPKNLIEIHKWYKTMNSAEDGNPEFYNNSLQAENTKMLDVNRFKIQKKESSASVSTERTLKESDENSKILLRIKRSGNEDFLTKNDETKKKTLLNLEGPNIFEDFESIKDQDNSLHIRVKRDNPNKNNIVPRFKSSYLEDLAASFPKSERELEEERLAFNKIGDEKLFKRSSDRDSDIEDQAPKHKKKRKNYVKVHPELNSMKDEIARSVSKIANEYQKKNLGKDTSYEYANDNQDDLQAPFRKDNKLIDSILSKMDYVVESGDLEKMNQQNDHNCASKTFYDNNNLYSSKVLQREQQNEANSKKESALRDKRRIKKHNKKKFKKKKSKKKRKKKKGRKHRKDSSKLSKLQGSVNQLEKVVGDIQVESKVDRRDSTDGKSEVDIAKRDISKVIKLGESENLKASNKVPNVNKFKTNTNEKKGLIDVDRSKRDAENNKKSSAPAKEIDKKKPLNEIKKSIDLKKRLTRNKSEHKQYIRAADHDNQELKFCKNIHGTETLNPNDASKLKVDRKRRALTDCAIKSVEEIKTFVDKLVVKVNDLQNIVNLKDTKCGKEKTARKKKSHLKSTLKNNKRCMVLEKPGYNISKVTAKSNLNIEKAQLLQDSRDEEPKKISARKANNLVQLKPDKISEEVRERKRVRRKRKSQKKWDRWTDWSGCSVTCGKGRQIRWRQCIRDCRVAETEMEEKTCQLPACPPGKFLGIF